MNRLDELDRKIANTWKEALMQPRVSNFMDMPASKDKRIFCIYMLQVYHYAFHNARNQALVGANLSNNHVQYMTFCFEHAMEETGHELMALHDLSSVGVNFDDHRKIPKPLQATELLISYLYYVAIQGNPVQRLGYSYWSESSYAFIRSFMEQLVVNMGLSKHQLTFFYSHSTIDSKHAEDVKRILLKVCKTDDDWASVERVAQITLKLTNDIFQESFDEYIRLRDEVPSEYAFLNGYAFEPTS